MTSRSDSEIVSRNLFAQTMKLWVEPELKKREREGKIKKGDTIYAYQVIFSVGGQNQVRLNQEVQVIIKAKSNKTLNNREKVSLRDIEQIQEMKLVENEKDFGHITAIKLRDGWSLSFSFIYDVTKAREYYEIGVEYLKSAKQDLLKKQYRPMIESLFVAAENLARSRIMLLPDKEIRSSKTHGTVASKVNIYSRSGNIIRVNQKEAFNTLTRMRDLARYNPDFNISDQNAQNLWSDVASLQREVLLYLVRYQD